MVCTPPSPSASAATEPVSPKTFCMVNSILPKSTLPAASLAASVFSGRGASLPFSSTPLMVKVNLFAMSGGVSPSAAFSTFLPCAWNSPDALVP